MKNVQIYPSPFCSYCDEKGLPSDHLLRDKYNKNNKKAFLCPVILKKIENKKKRQEMKAIKKGNVFPESPTTPEKITTLHIKERPVKPGRKLQFQQALALPKLFLETTQKEVIPIGPFSPKKREIQKMASMISVLDASENTIDEIPIKPNEEFWTDNYFSDIDEPEEYHF
jgi:hypothetical protein